MSLQQNLWYTIIVQSMTGRITTIINKDLAWWIAVKQDHYRSWTLLIMHRLFNSSSSSTVIIYCHLLLQINNSTNSCFKMSSCAWTLLAKTNSEVNCHSSMLLLQLSVVSSSSLCQHLAASRATSSVKPVRLNLMQDLQPQILRSHQPILIFLRPSRQYSRTIRCSSFSKFSLLQPQMPTF